MAFALLLGTDGGAYQVTVSRGSALEQTINSAVCKMRPLEFRHSSHTTSSGGAESVVSVSTGCSTLLLLHLRKHAAPGAAPARPAARHSRRELSFADHHGAISCHDWLPDGKLILGFSTGAGTVSKARCCFERIMSIMSGSAAAFAGQLMIICANASGAHVEVAFRQYLGAEPVTNIAFCDRSQRLAVAAGTVLAVMHLQAGDSPAAQLLHAHR